MSKDRFANWATTAALIKMIFIKFFEIIFDQLIVIVCVVAWLSFESQKVNWLIKKDMEPNFKWNLMHFLHFGRYSIEGVVFKRDNST